MLYETLSGLSVFLGGVLFASSRLGKHFFDKRNLIWMFSTLTIFLISLFFISRNPVLQGEPKIFESLITSTVLMSVYAFGIFLGFREWLVRTFIIRTVLVYLIFGIYVSILMEWLIILLILLFLFLLVIWRIILSKNKEDDVLSTTAYALLNLSTITIAILYITLVGFEFFRSTDIGVIYNAFIFGFLLFEIVLGISILSTFLHLFFPVSPTFYDSSNKFLKENGKMFVIDYNYKRMFILPCLFVIILALNHFFSVLTPVHIIASLLIINEFISKTRI